MRNTIYIFDRLTNKSNLYLTCKEIKIFRVKLVGIITWTQSDTFLGKRILLGVVDENRVLFHFSPFFIQRRKKKKGQTEKRDNGYSEYSSSFNYAS